jgi:ribonucleoside-diphosphate reductase alpha chain
MAEESSDDDLDDELENLAQTASSQPRAKQSSSAGAGGSTASAGAAGPAAVAPAGIAVAKAAPTEVHSSAELLDKLQGRASDAPMCFTCGTKMRPAGSCFVCEGCGSTSGCS